MSRHPHRHRSAAEVADALLESGGDAKAVAARLSMTTDAVRTAGRRMGLSLVQIKRASRVKVGLPGEVRIPLEDYLSLVAQANSTGTVWAEQERIIETLTRMVKALGQELEARAA